MGPQPTPGCEAAGGNALARQHTRRRARPERSNVSAIHTLTEVGDPSEICSASLAATNGESSPTSRGDRLRPADDRGAITLEVTLGRTGHTPEPVPKRRAPDQTRADGVVAESPRGGRSRSTGSRSATVHASTIHASTVRASTAVRLTLSAVIFTNGECTRGCRSSSSTTTSTAVIHRDLKSPTRRNQIGDVQIQPFQAEMPSWNYLHVLNDMAHLDRHPTVHFVTSFASRGRTKSATADLFRTSTCFPDRWRRRCLNLQKWIIGTEWTMATPGCAGGWRRRNLPGAGKRYSL